MELRSMKPVLVQSIIQLMSFLAIFLIGKSVAAVYIIPILGILTIIYILISYKKDNLQQPNSSPGKILTMFLLTTSVLLLLVSTGGINSVLFPLLYFLPFALAAILEPQIVFVFCIGVFALFLPDSLKADTNINIIKLCSILLIGPLAFFFGKAIRTRDVEEDYVEEATEKIREDVAELVTSEGTELKEKEITALKDIVDKSRELEKDIKNEQV